MDLVDGLEKSCRIFMSDKCLLDAFCDIPRSGYLFKTTFDSNGDMWLLIHLVGGEVGRISGDDMRWIICQKDNIISEKTMSIMPGSPLAIVDEQRYEVATTSLGPERAKMMLIHL